MPEGEGAEGRDWQIGREVEGSKYGIAGVFIIPDKNPHLSKPIYISYILFS